MQDVCTPPSLAAVSQHISLQYKLFAPVLTFYLSKIPINETVRKEDFDVFLLHKIRSALEYDVYCSYACTCNQQVDRETEPVDPLCINKTSRQCSKPYNAMSGFCCCLPLICKLSNAAWERARTSWEFMLNANRGEYKDFLNLLVMR